MSRPSILQHLKSALLSAWRIVHAETTSSLVQWDLSETLLAEEFRRLLHSFRLPLRKPDGLWIQARTGPSRERERAACTRWQRAYSKPPGVRLFYPGKLLLSSVIFHQNEPEDVTAWFAYGLARSQNKPMMGLLMLFYLPFAAAVTLIALMTQRLAPDNALVVGIAAPAAIIVLVLAPFHPHRQRQQLLRAGAAWIAAAPAERRSLGRFLGWIILNRIYAREPFQKWPAIVRWTISPIRNYPAVRLLSRQTADEHRAALEVIESEIDKEADPETVRALPDYRELRRLLG